MFKQQLRKLRRKFRGTFIPKKILLTKGLSMSEKYILAEVDSLDGEDHCWAMNRHFADLIGISPDRAGKIISGLVRKGFLERQITLTSGGKSRILRVASHTVEVTDGHTVETPDGHTVDPPLPSGENTGCYKEERTVRGQKGEDLPPTVSGSYEKRAELLYLAAKKSLTETVDSLQYPEPEFFEWFEAEVMGRWDKYSVTKAVLVDWHDIIWKVYNPDTILTALRKFKTESSNWSPDIGKCRKECAKIRAADKKRAEPQKIIEQPTPWRRPGFIDRIKTAKPEAIRRCYKRSNNMFYRSLIVKYRLADLKTDKTKEEAADAKA